MAAPSPVKTLPISSIKPRPSKALATRELNLKHVLDLAQSIGTVDLIEPLVVDQKGCLIAGGHRLFACTILAVKRDEDLEVLIGGSFNFIEENVINGLSLKGAVKKAKKIRDEAQFIPSKVPVRVLPIDAKKDPQNALIAEAVENEKRRDYSKEEIVKLAGSLSKLPGISSSPGRPEKGKQKLNPMLQAVTGKSQRTIRRLLQDPTGKKASKGASSKTKSHEALKRAVEKYLPKSRDKHLNGLLTQVVRSWKPRWTWGR